MFRPATRLVLLAAVFTAAACATQPPSGPSSARSPHLDEISAPPTDSGEAPCDTTGGRVCHSTMPWT